MFAIRFYLCVVCTRTNCAPPLCSSLAGPARCRRSMAAPQMAHSKRPIGTWEGASHLRLHASFASQTPQRVPTAGRPATGNRGPGFYQPLMHIDFNRYAAPPTSPTPRQPFRAQRGSAQLRVGSTRYVCGTPRITPPPAVADNVPGPGAYNMEQYSQFSPRTRTTPRFHPLSVPNIEHNLHLNFQRGMPTIRIDRNPGPSCYAPIPLLDRVHISMPRRPSTAHSAKIHWTAHRGRTLKAFVDSPASLSATLADVKRRTETR